MCLSCDWTARFEWDCIFNLVLGFYDNLNFIDLFIFWVTSSNWEFIWTKDSVDWSWCQLLWWKFLSIYKIFKSNILQFWIWIKTKRNVIGYQPFSYAYTFFHAYQIFHRKTLLVVQNYFQIHKSFVQNLYFQLKCLWVNWNQHLLQTPTHR